MARGTANRPRDVAAELRTLRSDRQRRIEKMLHDDIARLAAGNALYWLAVVGGGLVINLALMLAIAR
jgi:hypothetical protein